MTRLDSFNPATGELVGSVQVTAIDDVADIVARARAAQPAWAQLGLDGRIELLRKAGSRLADAAADIGKLACQEMGKPLAQAQGEAGYAASGYASDLDELAQALAPEVLENKKVRSTVYRDAFGVAACIAPWNFPVLMPHQQLLPALAAGNTVVFKPSEKTPLTGQAYAELLAAVLPADVLQVIHGDAEQGVALVASDVDLIVFTGSRAAGKHILAEASKRLKRVVLELGGKDPLVVLDDADVPRAARFAARNSFRNAGQVCVSTERIYVLPAVRDAFVSAMAEAAATMNVGDGMDPATEIGPMVDAEQKAHVAGQLADAVAAGATIAWGGDERAGNFLSPVILTNVTHDMSIASDETFGPVACIIDVEGEDDAIAKANDTPFGLGAIVFGEAERARRVARRLTAGMVGVNQGLASGGATPWVGARESGYGYHSGIEGHRQFAQTRVLSEPVT